ncbi:MAG: tetratricopeptide repeat protein [Pirellulales bacterium]
MTSSHSHEAFRQFLGAAAADRIAPGPHVADDDALLERWSAGYLDSAETRQITDHLAACTRCATLVAQMVKSGTLVLPLIEESTADSMAASAQSSSPPGAGGGAFEGPLGGSRRPFLAIASLAVAATLVAAVLYFGGRSNSAEGQLALAKGEFARGDHLAALERVEGLISRDVAEPLRTDALSVAREAAEKAAVERLEKGDFTQVSQIAARVDRLGVATDQVVNADLQARRADPAIVSLARSGGLLDYGYDLNGQAFQKGFPTFDAAFEQQQKQWEQALQKYPDSLLLRVNFGQFLLKAGAIAAAESQFSEALDRQPDSVDAQLGLGLARYERQDYTAALDAFQAVMRERPQSATAAINAALASEALQRPDDARRYWRQALPLVDDPTLRDQIERHIQESPKN